MILTSYNWENDTFTQHTTPPARITFREAVLQVADKAKAVLPANASRIDKAVALVLNGFVEIVDGKCRVASQTNGKTLRDKVSDCHPSQVMEEFPYSYPTLPHCSPNSKPV